MNSNSKRLLGAAAGLLLVAWPGPLTADGMSQHRVFRSADRGRSWVEADGRLPRNNRVNALLANGGVVYAGRDDGVYRSLDSGDSWERWPAGTLSRERVLCLAELEGSVYAGTERSGILVNGKHSGDWAVAAPASFPRKVRSLCAVGKFLFAGTDTYGIFRSDDSGKSWALANDGMPVDAQIFDLAAVGATVFAGCYSKGLYRLAAGSKSWSKAGTVSPLVLASIRQTLVVGHNPGGVFWTEDLGKTWQEAHGLPFVAPVWAMASNRDQVFAGVADGVYYSDDQGRTWTKATEGLPEKGPGISFAFGADCIFAGVTAGE